MTAIFHPTDLSPASAVAFRHALRLSLHDGAALTIMHVHGPLSADTPWKAFPAVRDTLSEWHEGTHHLPRVRKIEASGREVANVLSDYLDRHDADLIVLASHPREGIAAMVRPPVSQALFRKTHLPTLVVPEGQEGFVRFDGEIRLDTLLLPVAEEPDPQIGVDFVFSLMTRVGVTPGRLVTLHAGDTPVRHAPALPKGVAVEPLAMKGDADDAIVRSAGTVGADLIVMTSAGHDSVHDMLFGSTFEQVVRHAPCPVLVLPARG